MSAETGVPERINFSLEDYAKECDLGRVALRQGDGLLFVEESSDDPLDIIFLGGDAEEIERKRQAVRERYEGMRLPVVEQVVDADSPLVRALLQKRGWV